MKNVVIIGSGIGGLTAGAKLAKQGYKVTVIEKHIIPGGYATNFFRKAKTGEKVTFDVALHGIGNLADGRSFYEQLKEIGIFDKVKQIRKKETATLVYNNGEIFDIPDEFEKYKQELTNKFPHEKEGISKLFDFLKQFDYEMEEKVFRKGIISDFITTLQDITLYDFLKQYINDEKCIDTFSFLWLYYGLPAKKINAYYYLIAWTGYHIGGTYYIEGGSGVLSKAIADIIEENGGQVVLREEVVSLKTEGNKVVSVTTDKGKTFKADYFLINGCLETTLKRVDNIQKVSSYLEGLKSRQIGCSLSQLYIGMDCDPTELGIVKADYFFDYEEGGEKGFEYMQKGDFEKAHFGLVNYNLLDPNLNKDTGYVCITLGDFENIWPERDTEEYKAKKEEVTNILLKRFYKHFPKAEGHVVITELGTPRTMERYTSNKSGAVYGFAQDLENGAFNRLGSGTPFENTYIASAWAQPGGGFEGAMLSGIFACKVLMDKDKREKTIIPQYDVLEPNMFIRGMIEDANRKNTKGLKAKYLFNFKDINKTYFIVVKNGKVYLDKKGKNPDVEIICDYKTWTDIANSKISGEAAFRSGNLKVKGDINKFTLIEKIFEPVEQVIEQPERKLVKGELIFTLGLAPFILYWATSKLHLPGLNYITYALFATLYTLLFIPILKPKYVRNTITTLEKTNIITFTLMLAFSFTGNQWLANAMELILPLSLIITSFVGENAIGQYTKLAYLPSVSKTKLFNKINRNLSLLWSVIFIAQYLVAKVFLDSYLLSNLIYLLSLLGIIISYIYPIKATGKK